MLAHRMAQAIAQACPSLLEVSVQVLSTIGRPVDEPDLVAIRLADAGGTPTSDSERRARDIADSQLRNLDHLLQELIEG
ncbi:methionine adenosyltransferase, partial [Acinetobacter baumannii]